MTKDELAEKRPLIKYNNKIFPCPTSVAMELIGGKWKSVILAYLIDGTKRYSELRKLIPTITERTLSLQLKKLESDGLVLREVYTQKPPLKVEYSLTKFGESVVPTIKMIINWGVEASEARGEYIIDEDR